MASKVALGHHHAIVVIAVKVSAVAGSTRAGQRGTMSDGNLTAQGAMMVPMPDRELGTWGPKMEGATGHNVGHMACTGDRCGGRVGSLDMRVAS